MVTSHALVWETVEAEPGCTMAQDAPAQMSQRVLIMDTRLWR